jgi:3-oxoacyl-[acyl-carrier protein] reductase
MSTSDRLQGRVALVTGASRGLGRAIAQRLAADGAAVAVNYAHSREGADETVASIVAAGGTASAFAADVTDAEQVAAMVEGIGREFGRGVDVLVNNATGPQPNLTIEESSWDDYLAQLEFFVKAPLLLLKSVLPHMEEAGEGSVVNIGSEVVYLGSTPFATYVSAKAAMLGLTRSWSVELAERGIRVNLVAPGWIPVERHAGDDTSGYRKGVPLGRMGRPEEIADAVAFFASSETSFVTGQCLSVNGGLTFE